MYTQPGSLVGALVLLLSCKCSGHVIVVPPELAREESEILASKAEKLSAKDQLTRGILDMNGDNVAVLADSLLDSKSMHMEKQLSSKLKAKEMQQSDELSDVTRYVSVGYNLIKGNPEGDFYSGGRDTGVKLLYQIFKFSFIKQKTELYLGMVVNEPDQVEFEPYDACVTSTSNEVYSGAKSYRDEIAVEVDAEGS